MRFWMFLLLPPLISTAGLVPAAEAAPISWAIVGDPGNAANSDGYGSVSQTYWISRTEVTNEQYTDFLNRVDPTGTNARALYSSSMGTATSGGIRFEGSNDPGSRYVIRLDRADWPVNFVTVDDTLRFANWMNNGRGTADTESGAYDLSSGGSGPVARSAGATVFLPSENEWYKAAYFDPIGSAYHLYPGGSGLVMSCSEPGSGSNSANCDDAVGGPTDVASYVGSASPYRSFDQGGNVFEWTEGVHGAGLRVFRGGDWESVPGNLSSAKRFVADPAAEFKGLGFRLGSSVPEPSTGVLLFAGLGFLGVGRKRAARPFVSGTG